LHDLFKHEALLFSPLPIHLFILRLELS